MVSREKNIFLTRKKNFVGEPAKNGSLLTTREPLVENKKEYLQFLGIKKASGDEAWDFTILNLKNYCYSLPATRSTSKSPAENHCERKGLPVNLESEVTP